MKIKKNKSYSFRTTDNIINLLKALAQKHETNMPDMLEELIKEAAKKAKIKLPE